MHKQVSLVRASLDGAGITAPVHGAICFLEGDWPMIGGSFVVDDIHVLWPRLLVKRISAESAQQDIDIDQVHSLLARSFPVA